MQATLKRSSICKLHNLSPTLGDFLRVNENTEIINGRIFVTIIHSDCSGQTRAYYLELGVNEQTEVSSA